MLYLDYVMSRGAFFLETEKLLGYLLAIVLGPWVHGYSLEHKFLWLISRNQVIYLYVELKYWRFSRSVYELL